MVKYLKTDNRKIHEVDSIEDGVWIHMVNPTVSETQMIADALMVDVDDLLAALDEEESSRIELEDGYTLILADIPAVEMRHEKETYTTIPLGIIITSDVIVTVCTEETPVLQAFLNNRVKEFSTKKKLRFLYQILYRSNVLYQSDLRIIDKKRTEIEEKIEEGTKEEDLIALHELESTLVYFATSLRANGVVLDRLTRYKRLEQYPEDKELLDDVIVENKQAIEMTSLFLSFLPHASEQFPVNGRVPRRPFKYKGKRIHGFLRLKAQLRKHGLFSGILKAHLSMQCHGSLILLVYGSQHPIGLIILLHQIKRCFVHLCGNTLLLTIRFGMYIA